MSKLKLGALLISLGLSTTAVAANETSFFSINYNQQTGNSIHMQTTSNTPTNSNDPYIYLLKAMPDFTFDIEGYASIDGKEEKDLVECTTTGAIMNRPSLESHLSNLPVGKYTAHTINPLVDLTSANGSFSTLVTNINEGENFLFILNTSEANSNISILSESAGNMIFTGQIPTNSFGYSNSTITSFFLFGGATCKVFKNT